MQSLLSIKIPSLSACVRAQLPCWCLLQESREFVSRRPLGPARGRSVCVHGT